jgi:hypothetical protein
LKQEDELEEYNAQFKRSADDLIVNTVEEFRSKVYKSTKKLCKNNVSFGLGKLMAMWRVFMEADIKSMDATELSDFIKDDCGVVNDGNMGMIWNPNLKGKNLMAVKGSLEKARKNTKLDAPLLLFLEKTLFSKFGVVLDLEESTFSIPSEGEWTQEAMLMAGVPDRVISLINGKKYGGKIDKYLEEDKFVHPIFLKRSLESEIKKLDLDGSKKKQPKRTAPLEPSTEQQKKVKSEPTKKVTSPEQQKKVQSEPNKRGPSPEPSLVAHKKPKKTGALSAPSTFIPPDPLPSKPIEKRSDFLLFDLTNSDDNDVPKPVTQQLPTNGTGNAKVNNMRTSTDPFHPFILEKEVVPTKRERVSISETEVGLPQQQYPLHESEEEDGGSYFEKLKSKNKAAKLQSNVPLVISSPAVALGRRLDPFNFLGGETEEEQVKSAPAVNDRRPIRSDPFHGVPSEEKQMEWAMNDKDANNKGEVYFENCLQNNANSCHLDAFLESCYSCLITNTPGWLNDAKVDIWDKIDDKNDVDLLKHAMCIRHRSNKYDAQEIGAYIQTWRLVMKARHPDIVREDERNNGSPADWVDCFNQPNDLFGLNMQVEYRCNDCKNKEVLPQYQSSIFLNVDQVGDTLEDKIMIHLALEETPRCKLCGGAQTHEYNNLRPGAILFVNEEIGDLVSMQNQVKLGETTLQVAANIRCRKNGGHFVSYIRRGKSFNLFDTSRIYTKRFTTEEQMNSEGFTHRTYLCLGKKKE